jgi:PAS domain S-box-containing protein
MNVSLPIVSVLGRARVRRARQQAGAGSKKIRAEFAFALALMVIIGVVSYLTTLKLWATELREARIEAVLAKLEVISSKVKDAEASHHGYIITADQRYLEPYHAATQTIDQELNDLQTLTADEPSRQSKIDILVPLIADRFAEIAQTNALRRHHGFEPAVQVVSTHNGKQMVDAILRTIGELKGEQSQLLLQEVEEAEARAQAVNMSITFGSFAAIMLAALMIGRDIIERKRADEALRESTARFRRLAENALDMIYRYRLVPSPGFEYVSPAATVITGYSPEDFYADPELAYKLVHPEDHGLIESLKHPVDAAVLLTVRWIGKDGTVTWTSQQLVPIYDLEGNLVAIEGIVRDITERMQAYQILEQRVEERTHEIERRRQVAEVLRDIMTILNSNRSLDEILDSIVDQACCLLGTGAGAVYRLEAQEGLLSAQAARGLDAEHAAVGIPSGWGVIGQVVLTRQPVAISHAIVALQNPADLMLEPEFRARLMHLYERYSAWLVVPLMLKDEVYGAIALYYDKPREFSREEIEMAVAFSDQAALAIENARLRLQAEQTAVAAERSRLARDLHDAVTQTLFSSSLIADVLPRLWDRNTGEARRRLDELRQLTRSALAEMRTLLLELRPSSLIEAGLHELLRQLAEATTGRARVPVALTVEGQCHLPPDVQITFYRIAQEALNNIARHANATQAAICLRCGPERLELHISDNGQGFDPTSVAREHLGVGIMRERAEAIGATLGVDSQPGCGTQIVLIWPERHAVPSGQSSDEKRNGLEYSAVSGGGYD